MMKKNKEMVVKQADLMEKNQVLQMKINQLTQRLAQETGKISAGSGEGAISMPSLNSEAPAFDPNRGKKEESK